jgi:putative inorganic carbon (HCO3(-)) transporter
MFPLRDIFLVLFVFGSVPYILKRPIWGAYLWVWVSVMSPHRQTWTFAYDLPFAQVVAIATLAGILLTREPREFPVTRTTVALILLVLWMNVTTLFSINPSWVMWDKVMKSMFMLFVVMYLLHSKKHVQVLVWIVTLSIAYYGVKGGLFTLRGGGAEKVYGPAGSFIGENNTVGLAIVMTIPLLRYLHLQATNRWLRYALLGSMVLCGFSALGTQSRGALLAIGAMLGFLWLKTRNKIITGFLLALLVPFAIGFMPETWTKRMESIQNYEEDSSAMGRINAWMMAVNLVASRPIGGGFEIYDRSTFAQYAPNPLDVHAAHSIWFSVLGEHGIPGIVLYVLLWIFAWRDASWISGKTQHREGWQWAADLARMVQVSLVGYFVGGAFLSLAYYDVPYYLAIAIVLTRRLVEKEVQGDQKGWYTARPQPNAGLAGAQPAVSPAPFKPPLAADRSGLRSATDKRGLGTTANQPQISTDKTPADRWI